MTPEAQVFWDFRRMVAKIQRHNRFATITLFYKWEKQAYKRLQNERAIPLPPPPPPKPAVGCRLVPRFDVI